MPGFYSEEQINYFKELERKEHEKIDKKQAWKEGIRARMHEKKHPELGQAKKVKVAGVPEGFVAGNPAKNPAEGGVADMFKEQPPPVVKPPMF